MTTGTRTELARNDWEPKFNLRCGTALSGNRFFSAALTFSGAELSMLQIDTSADKPEATVTRSTSKWRYCEVAKNDQYVVVAASNGSEEPRCGAWLFDTKTGAPRGTTELPCVADITSLAMTNESLVYGGAAKADPFPRAPHVST